MPGTGDIKPLHPLWPVRPIDYRDKRKQADKQPSSAPPEQSEDNTVDQDDEPSGHVDVYV